LSIFYPALAHTDCIGYIDEAGNRKIMSVRHLIPRSMAQNFLISLSFDESIHYNNIINIGIPELGKLCNYPNFNTIFVDCGAFHYFNEKTPKFKKGGFVTSTTALDEYMRRHVKINPDTNYILCSPDHIILQNTNDADYEIRKFYIIKSAKSFIEKTKGIPNIIPIAVVHGRTTEERAEIAAELIKIGYNYLAFGGLVPMARNPSEVLKQVAGINDITNPIINPNSALGLAIKAGCKTHMFGLNSPEWYRWWKRIGITSFDGSKLSQEGAANGIIWKTNKLDIDNPPSTAKELYSRISIKKIKNRRWVNKNGIGHLLCDEDEIDTKSGGWEYFLQSVCTNRNCKQYSEIHHPDPRTTGSIEHNMGRMIINAYSFEKIMKNIDELCDVSDYKINDSRYDNWRKIVIR